MITTKHIVLCADDYGQAPHISKAIIDLIEHKRLSATSCLVTEPDWSDQAAYLGQYQEHIDIGLHFNLTEGKPLSALYLKTYGERLLPLVKLIRLAYFRKLKQDVILAECHAQLDAFLKVRRHIPRFIDGHHHVHQLPIVRTALLHVYQQRLAAYGVYVRFVNSQWKFSDLFLNPKKIIIHYLGTRAFKKQLVQHRIPHNRYFSGIYAFKRAKQSEALFRQLLLNLQEDCLVMCHPAQIDLQHQNEFLSLRAAEYRYLMSEQFQEDCARTQIKLCRFGTILKTENASHDQRLSHERPD